jgi:hypothetical protein
VRLVTVVDGKCEVSSAELNADANTGNGAE